MFKSIFGRMFWTYAILILVILSSIALSMSALLLQFAEKKQLETITSVANTIEDWTAIIQVEQQDTASVRAYENFLRSWAKFTASDITVVNRDGKISNSTCGIKSIPDKLLNSITTDKVVIQKSDFNDFYDNKVISFSLPLHNKGNVIGAMIFNRSLPDLRGAVFELLALFILSSLTSIFISIVIIYVQAKKISAPIASINKAAQNIAKGNFNQRVDVTTHDEIGQLASTFNFMASSIEKSEENRQRFISDVSHELRTPMTSITGFVQGILDGTIDEDQRENYLKIVLDESTRLTKLVNDMLEMSKMQSQEFKLEIKPFDVNSLIGSVLIGLESKIEEKGLDVDVDFRAENLIALGDKDQIKRVLLNLIDNAVKFSRQNTVIGIKTSIDKGKAHISISNTGDEISENDLIHIFDRFYKTDKSRQRDRTGAGLGLSLVQNIINAHSQDIWVTNKKSTDNGAYVTTFEFTLEVK